LVAGCKEGLIRSYDYRENQRAILCYERALSFKEKKEYANAITEFKRFLDYYSDIYFADEAYFHIADCWRLLGQFPEAREAYEDFIEKYTPPFILFRPFIKKRESAFLPEARFRIGECFEGEERWKEAVSVYYDVMKRHWQTEWASAAKERCFDILDRFSEAKWAKRERRRVEKLIRKQEKG
jgi:TolA-binding protein